MKWNEITGHWKQLQHMFKYKWSRLTDSDLKQIDGKHKELTDILEKHYGHSNKETKKNVEEFLVTLNCYKGLITDKIGKRLSDMQAKVLP